MAPFSKTVSSTSPGTPPGVSNSATDIGVERFMTPLTHSPRFRSTPSASRSTQGLPAYDFLPPAIGSLPMV